MQVAGVLAGLGDKESAIAWVEKGMQDRSGEMPRIALYSIFDPLREEPRFKAVVRQLGLPE